MCYDTATESNGMRFEDMHVFGRTIFVPNGVPIIIVVGVACSYRWWMLWLSHDTAIESDGVPLHQMHGYGSTILSSLH